MPVKFSLHTAKLDKRGDAPIRASIFILGQRFLTSVGYSINIDKWDSQRVKKGCNNARGITYSTINSKLADIEKYFIDFENDCKIKNLDVTDKMVREIYQGQFGKAKGLLIQNKTFLACFDEFTEEQGEKNNWTHSTFEKFAAIKNHLIKFKENPGFDLFDEKGLTAYVAYLRNTKLMRNSTIGKQMGFLKWFLRWATAKGYNTNNAYLSFKPKLKTSDKKVIFLTWEELMRVYTKEIPESKKYLARVRDVFCFCCFTSLRYSDVFNLKKSDIRGGAIHITTVKTADSIVIELNKYSKALLDKYKDDIFGGNKALPVISNQKMNDYIKELGEFCNINEPINITYYSGNKRTDEVFPKYELMGTHTGRRTFICNALSLGIPVNVVMKWTGHSDYKAMKPYIDIADKIKADSMRKFDSIKTVQFP
jgi:integrase